MGARAQVRIQMDSSESVYLYTHWGAPSLDTDVREALRKGQDRWDDPEYLARIVFQEMLHGDNGNTGYGIGTSEHGDIEYLITLTENQIVKIGEDEYSFKEFITMKNE